MASEKRLIDANLVDERLAADLESGEEKFSISWFRSWISVQETVDAVEVVHGRWEEHPRMTGYLRCSKCHDANIWDTWLEDGKWNYCPNCGAKMDGDGNG